MSAIASPDEIGILAMTMRGRRITVVQRSIRLRRDHGGIVQR